MIETWVGGEPGPYSTTNIHSSRSHLGEFVYSRGVRSLDGVTSPLTSFDGPLGRINFVGDDGPACTSDTLEDVYWGVVKEHMAVGALKHGLLEFASVARARAKEETREQIRDFFANTLGIGEE